MFHLSSRTRYALRALYELAAHEATTPLKIAAIARRQKIPVRFLEGILTQLKRGGFVESQRGIEGGYRLSRKSQYLTIGEVLRFLEGPVDFAPMHKKEPKGSRGELEDPFYRFWRRLNGAIVTIIDELTFRDLIEDNVKSGEYVPNYII